MYPKVFDLGAITIHTYGLFLAAAFIAGIWVTSRHGKKAGINPDAIWNIGLIVLFSALAGSKILLLFSDFRHYSANPYQIFTISTITSPEVRYSSLLLALGTAVWFIVKKGIRLWIMADISAPGVAIGQAIASLGCLSAGYRYGTPTQLPWAVTFTDPYVAQNLGVPLNTPLHPTQVYEALGCFLLFLYLMWRLSKEHVNGKIFLEYLGLYSLLEFSIEFVRGDARGYVLHGLLSIPQMIALFTFAVSFIAYVILHNRSEKALRN